MKPSSLAKTLALVACVGFVILTKTTMLALGTRIGHYPAVVIQLIASVAVYVGVARAVDARRDEEDPRS